MRSDLTDITVLLDRTGSMRSIKDDVIGGFNQFLDSQRTGPGEALITLIQFDSQAPSEHVYTAIPAPSAPALTPMSFQPRADTPLLYALWAAINSTGERLKAMPEAARPGKVVFVVITDGQENASFRLVPLITKEQINGMIGHQKDVYKWQFVFLSSNLDAVHDAAHAYNIPVANVALFAGGGGYRVGTVSTGEKVKAFRGGPIGNSIQGFSDAERDEMVGKPKPTEN